MLYSVNCKILQIIENQILVSIGSITLELTIPRPEVFAIEKETKIFTYLHWNQEQGPSLFGFSSISEKETFLLLLSCSGIGPRIALSFLSQISPAELVKAIQEQDLKVLSSVNGIGAKKAEQIAVQLKHKVEKIVDIVAADSGVVDVQGIKQLREVLSSLNYSGLEINSAVEYARHNASGAQFDILLRQALVFLSKSLS